MNQNVIILQSPADPNTPTVDKFIIQSGPYPRHHPACDKKAYISKNYTAHLGDPVFCAKNHFLINTNDCDKIVPCMFAGVCFEHLSEEYIQKDRLLSIATRGLMMISLVAPKGTVIVPSQSLVINCQQQYKNRRSFLDYLHQSDERGYFMVRYNEMDINDRLLGRTFSLPFLGDFEKPVIKLNFIIDPVHINARSYSFAMSGINQHYRANLYA